MNYSEVDKALKPWLTRHGLHLFTRARDEEVRSIDVVDDAGARYQIWISDANDVGKVRVSAWDFKKKKKVFESDFDELGQSLEDAYSQVTEWIQQAGHTRTPVL
jgi:hypothetical protein